MQLAPSSFFVGDISNFEKMVLELGDQRPMPQEDALAQFGSAVMTELLDLTMGTVLEDRLPTLAEGVIGAFHSIIQRLEREADRARDQVNMLARDFDGTEIADSELQEATQKARSADVAVQAIEYVRDAASETYTAATGEIWSPWKGNVRRSGSTMAQVQARDFIRASKAARSAQIAPNRTIIAFRGSPVANSPEDAGRIFDALNAMHSRFPDMALAVTGAKGAEKIAQRWAHQKGVDVVLAAADFDRNGKAAPFKANDEMLDLDPTICLTLPMTVNREQALNQKPFGPALNFGQKAQERGIRHYQITAKATA